MDYVEIIKLVTPFLLFSLSIYIASKKYDYEKNKTLLFDNIMEYKKNKNIILNTFLIIRNPNIKIEKELKQYFLKKTFDLFENGNNIENSINNINKITLLSNNFFKFLIPNFFINVFNINIYSLKVISLENNINKKIRDYFNAYNMYYNQEENSKFEHLNTIDVLFYNNDLYSLILFYFEKLNKTKGNCIVLDTIIESITNKRNNLEHFNYSNSLKVEIEKTLIEIENYFKTNWTDNELKDKLKFIIIENLKQICYLIDKEYYENLIQEFNNIDKNINKIEKFYFNT